MKEDFPLRPLSIYLFAVALLCFMVLPVTAQSPDPAAAKLPEPTLKLRGIDGKTYDLAEMRGSVVLVSFGATWCPPCTPELRALQELTLEYKDKPVKFFWVTIENESESSDKKIARFAKTRRLTFPVLRDPMRFTFNQFSLREKLPMIVFFDREGHVDAAPHFGMSAQPEIYKNSMRQRLNKLLATSRSDGQQED